MGAWDTLLSWCRCELSKEERRAEWEEVKRRRADLAALASPAAVLELLDRRTSGPASDVLLEQRSRVLLALLEEHQGGSRSLAQAVLIVAFEPTLRSLHRRFSKVAPDDELASLVLEALLGAAASYPLERRRSKVAANLVHDAEARLCRRFEGERRRELVEQEAVEELEHRGDEALSVFDLASDLRPPAGDGPSEDDVDDALQVLDLMVRRGVINVVDRHLIAAANVRGLQLKAWVATCPEELDGMSYEAAKKRLQRAVGKVRIYLSSRRLQLLDLLESGNRQGPMSPRRPPRT